MNGKFNLGIIINTVNSQLKVVTSMYILSCQWPFMLSTDKDCTINVNSFCCSYRDCVNNERCKVGSYYFSTLLGYCLSNYNI